MSESIEKSGKIVAISLSSKKGIPKTNVSSANLIENWGIEGDAHAGNWHRQVSLLAFESIEKMINKGLPLLKPGDFAENITTSFIKVPLLNIGNKVQIGQAVLEITQIGKECHNRCAIYNAVGECIMPKEGIFAKVLKGGQINVFDDILILD